VPQIDPEPGASGQSFFEAPVAFSESLNEVFARRWTGFSEDDGRSIAEGANITQQRREVSLNALRSRRGDRST
jgi:hypothetical protein